MHENGPSEAFAKLFAQNERRIYSYILSLTADWSAAEEVFQETCVVMWQKFADFQPGTDFASWACRIAFFKVQKYREGQSRRPALLSDRFLETVSDTRLAGGEPSDERLAALAKCMKKLAPGDHDLIARRYSGNVTIQQVALDVGRPANTVYKAINRIRKNLLKCIQRALRSEDSP